jgi:hypothetical protein
MYPVTIVYPDSDTAEPGILYLPGEPVAFPDTDCAMCCTPIAARPDGWPSAWAPSRGAHAGYVVTLPLPDSVPTNSEPMHLRCVLDVGEQYQSIGMMVGNTELPDSGRHLADAPDRSTMTLRAM